MNNLDRIDLAIVRLLSEQGRMPVTELGISKSPCQVRLKRLQREGYILGFRAVLNPQLMNREHIAFTEVKLTDTREAALSAFNEAVQLVPEIEQCHMIAGAYDYLLKIRTSDIKAYRQVLAETLSTLPHVASTSTFVSMQSVKDSAF